MLKKLFSLGRKSVFIRCRFWPLLTLLVTLVIILQVLHIALISRIDARALPDSGSPLAGVGRLLQGRTLSSILNEMRERVSGSYRLDRSGTYHVIENFLTSEMSGPTVYDVTVATQCSSNHLGYLDILARQWDGPVSVAVFTHHHDFIAAVSRMLHLHFCSDDVYRHVTFHIVFPISRAPRDLNKLKDIKLGCKSNMIFNFKNSSLTSSFITNIDQSSNYADTELAYPNNLLRNLAIKYVQTPYVFMIDIDMVPSAGLRADFQTLITSLINTSTSSNQSLGGALHISRVLTNMTAFVVPVFEIESGIQLPGDKSELLYLWRQRRVRPFYWEECVKCQRLTDYDRWIALEVGEHLGLAYSVQRNAFWEPFYIAKKSLPLYDERFKQYGFNRVSQVCEMHISGYQFQVLNHAFLIHNGFKTRNSHHSRKDLENRRNKQLYSIFKSELKKRYPSSLRVC